MAKYAHRAEMQSMCNSLDGRKALVHLGNWKKPSWAGTWEQQDIGHEMKLEKQQATGSWEPWEPT